jgi:hypothetical protein
MTLQGKPAGKFRRGNWQGRGFRSLERNTLDGHELRTVSCPCRASLVLAECEGASIFRTVGAYHCPTLTPIQRKAKVLEQSLIPIGFRKSLDVQRNVARAGHL